MLLRFAQIKHTLNFHACVLPLVSTTCCTTRFTREDADIALAPQHCLENSLANMLHEGSIAESGTDDVVELF